MSRLFYDKPKGLEAEEFNAVSTDTTKEYLEKVAKIIPGEVIAAYLAMIGFVPLIKNEALHQPAYWTVFAFGTLGTGLYINYQADPNRPKWAHIAVSIISFLLWAYDTTGEKICPGIYDSAIAAILLIGFSFFSGKIPLK